MSSALGRPPLGFAQRVVVRLRADPVGRLVQRPQHLVEIFAVCRRAEVAADQGVEVGFEAGGGHVRGLRFVRFS